MSAGGINSENIRIKIRRAYAKNKRVADGLITPSLSATERRYKNFKRARKELGYEL